MAPIKDCSCLIVLNETLDDVASAVLSSLGLKKLSVAGNAAFVMIARAVNTVTILGKIDPFSLLPGNFIFDFLRRISSGAAPIGNSISESLRFQCLLKTEKPA